MTLLFYYTLLIMFFYTIVAATSLSAFYVSRRRTFLYATVGFAFYFFDVSLVFKDNFITPDAVFEAASFYDVGHPYTSIITGGGAFLFLWLAACRYCREERPVVRFAPVALWAALSLAAYQFIENPQWREFIYYNLRAVLQLACYGLLAWWYTHSPDPERRSIMKSHRTAFFWAIGLTCGIILENVYVQLIFDPGSIPRGMWVLAERSPMENLLFICYGLAVLRGASVSLQLRARELPEGDDPLLAESIDRLLPLYSRTYDLSKREEEVLRHALMGKDNQNIASALTLSAGTVKVHMHNILKKTGHANRAELAADFWDAHGEGQPEHRKRADAFRRHREGAHAQHPEEDRPRQPRRAGRRLLGALNCGNPSPRGSSPFREVFATSREHDPKGPHIVLEFRFAN